MRPKRTPTARLWRRRGLVAVPLLALIPLTGCAPAPQALTGEVIAKKHVPGCTVRKVIGTASGALAYDTTVNEAWVLVVRHPSAHPDDASGYETSPLEVDAHTWHQTAVGSTYTDPDPYWFNDRCPDAN